MILLYVPGRLFRQIARVSAHGVALNAAPFVFSARDRLRWRAFCLRFLDQRAAIGILGETRIEERKHDGERVHHCGQRSQSALCNRFPGLYADAWFRERARARDWRPDADDLRLLG